MEGWGDDLVSTQSGVPGGLSPQAQCVRGLSDSQLCNSHHVSQFATLVIVAGAEVSIVNSR